MDTEQDAIIIWSQRVDRPHVHEFTCHRVIKEKHSFLEGVTVDVKLSTPDLENFCLHRLKEIDVWSKYGSGKSFDNYLQNEEETYRERERKKYRSQREAMWKENRGKVKEAVWNAQHGRFDDRTAIKMPDRVGIGWEPKKG